MTIKQSVSIKASAEQVYTAMTSADQFSKVTGAPAEISADEGGAFTCFGGEIAGLHIELLPNERIVQSWRVVNMWPEGVYSTVRFDLSESGDTTTITLEQTGHPDDATAHLEPGWHKMYWEPLKAYLE
jgi:activator of HSP90 ATPase